MVDKFEMIKMVLEHILKLHFIGIIADEQKIEEEKFEFEEKLIAKDYDNAAIELADYRIANLSHHISKLTNGLLVNPNFLGAMFKNNKRADWIIEHRDKYPDSTPQALWDLSKVVLEQEDNEQV